MEGLNLHIFFIRVICIKIENCTKTRGAYPKKYKNSLLRVDRPQATGIKQTKEKKSKDPIPGMPEQVRYLVDRFLEIP